MSYMFTQYFKTTQTRHIYLNQPIFIVNYSLPPFYFLPLTVTMSRATVRKLKPPICLYQQYVMWCEVMWSDVMCCDVKWCDVKWCDVIWSDVMWSDAMWCDVKWCDVKWCDVKCCEVMWCEVMWSDVMWSEVMWSEVMWSDAMWSDVMWFEMMWCEVMCCDVPIVSHVFNERVVTTLTYATDQTRVMQPIVLCLP